MKISRREFLKGSAAAGLAATGLMAGTVMAEEAPMAEEKEISETRDTEVLIVGAGGAGLHAAYNLCKAGKQVLVMEKGPSVLSSNFSRCGGPTAAHTTLQMAEDADVSVDQVFQFMNGFANHTVNSRLLYTVISCTGQALNTMTDELGIPMFLMNDTYGVGFRGRHMFMAGGPDRTQPFVDFIEGNGGEFIYDTRAMELLYDGEVVSGVLGMKEDGTYLQVNAKATVLCTGGFQGSEEKIKRFFGNINVKSLGSDTPTGDAIDMVEAIGGSLDRNFALLGNEGSATTTKIPGAIWFGEEPTNHCLGFGLHGGLLVDPSGDRFCNEKDIADFPLALGGELFARAGKSYAIIDSATFEAATTVGPYEAMGEPENWLAGKALWIKVLDNAPEMLDKAIEQGWAWKADTLAEIAEHFHLTHLEETVAEYNAMCEAGEDTMFGKAPNFMNAIGDGPYYCFEYESACWSTNGGIKTDARLRALDANQDPIPGLYVAGVDNGSLYCSPYYINEGASIGMAIGSGVLVAKEIVEFLGE